MDALDFQIKQHQNFLKQRNIDRIIQSAIFEETWNLANKKDREQAEFYIRWLEVRLLQLWTYSDFENYTARELRQIASNNHISNYCFMTKSELIQHFLEKGIKDERNRETINRNETISTSSGSTKSSDSRAFWGAQGKNIRWSL